jgi:hypothetical protein
MNRTIPGDTINDLIVSKRAEVTIYNALLTTYNAARSLWNGSLRIADGLVDWSTWSLFIPQDAQNVEYVQPPRPVMPYHPTAYSGPTFSETTPIIGYGIPTSTMYDL